MKLKLTLKFALILMLITLVLLANFGLATSRNSPSKPRPINNPIHVGSN
jgi:hypothetical protein